MQWLKQSTIAILKMGPFIDPTNGNPMTGLSIAFGDVRVSKNGGPMAAKSDTSASPHNELGKYDVTANATDTGTLGRLNVTISKSGALIVDQEYMVVSAQVYDSLFGTDRLQVHVDEMSAGIITAATLANDCITAAKLAPDVTTEIQAGLATAASVATLAETVDATWDELLSGHTIPGSAGAALTAASAGGGGSTPAAIADAVWNRDATANQILGSFGQAIGDPGTSNISLFKAVVTDANGATVGEDTANLIANVSTLGELVDGTWDELLSGHTIAGSAGKALSDAALGGGGGGLDAAGVRAAIGMASANMDTQLAGHQSDLDNIQTRLPAGLVGGLMNSHVGGMSGATVDAPQLTAAACQKIADEFLDRNLTGSASGGARNIRSALRTLRNKTQVIAGVFTCFAEDDTTVAFTANVTTSAGNPINSFDPVT